MAIFHRNNDITINEKNKIIFVHIFIKNYEHRSKIIFKNKLYFLTDLFKITNNFTYNLNIKLWSFCTYSKNKSKNFKLHFKIKLNG